MKYQFLIGFVFTCILLSGCQEYSPKPKGHLRIDLPTTLYNKIDSFDYFSFDLSDQTSIDQLPSEEDKIYFNIKYSLFNAEIYCSYLPVKNKNISQLSEESRKFVYLHVLKAEAIQEQIFENREQRVFGLVYNIKGNVASPTQFTLTDSIHSFFRGALYFNHIPNQDSIAPILEYINKDIQILIESFQWKQ